MRGNATERAVIVYVAFFWVFLCSYFVFFFALLLWCVCESNHLLRNDLLLCQFATADNRKSDTSQRVTPEKKPYFMLLCYKRPPHMILCSWHSYAFRHSDADQLRQQSLLCNWTSSLNNLPTVVVVVVDVYSASRSASNALVVPLRCKKLSFQSQSEVVGTPSRVPEWVIGSEFHSIGPTTEKARRPNVLLWCRGTISWWWLASLRCWPHTYHASVSDSHWWHCYLGSATTVQCEPV